MQKTDVLNNVVILGGGFAGTRAAIDLAKKNLPHTKITLISNKSYFEYYPGLYRVVTGASPIEVCVPLEDMVPPSVDIVIDTITSIDIANKKIVGAKLGDIDYSRLVIALGSETTYFNLPGLDTLSLGFKSTKEALRLKHHIFELFKTHMHPNQNELTSHFHVVVVGGGPSGIEVAKGHA
jgi:NADH dehydrogenase FAD-containing subunit